jgi:hypothetical protein
VTQAVGPEFKPQYRKKKRKENVTDLVTISFPLFFAFPDVKIVLQ